MQQRDVVVNGTVPATFDVVNIISNSTQTEDFIDIITVRNNPIFIGIFCGCVFLVTICAFMWSYLRTNPSERFDLTLTMSVSNNNSTSQQTSYKDGHNGRESVFKLLNETIDEMYENE
ncbi:Hypothetical predicted protein [Mytilus galloprovincialis]|uniref:Uncharacterized protein n=1 Tax=Mytilus galloprovincialis TaxID=29158 RepID=A0A8B6ESD9_MYTGA|nr:Hypothetical predicted protein [Mytilus galloprovincialis]